MVRVGSGWFRFVHHTSHTSSPTAQVSPFLPLPCPSAPYLIRRSPGPARAVRTSHGRRAAMLRAAWWHVVRWLSWPLPWLRRGCHNSRIFDDGDGPVLVVVCTAGRRLVATFGPRLVLKVPRVGRAAAVLPARGARSLLAAACGGRWGGGGGRGFMSFLGRFFESRRRDGGYPY